MSIEKYVVISIALKHLKNSVSEIGVMRILVGVFRYGKLAMEYQG